MLSIWSLCHRRLQKRSKLYQRTQRNVHSVRYLPIREDTKTIIMVHSFGERNQNDQRWVQRCQKVTMYVDDAMYLDTIFKTVRCLRLNNHLKGMSAIYAKSQDILLPNVLKDNNDLPLVNSLHVSKLSTWSISIFN